MLPKIELKHKKGKKLSQDLKVMVQQKQIMLLLSLFQNISYIPSSNSNLKTKSTIIRVLFSKIKHRSNYILTKESLPISCPSARAPTIREAGQHREKKTEQMGPGFNSALPLPSLVTFGQVTYLRFIILIYKIGMIATTQQCYHKASMG